MKTDGAIRRLFTFALLRISFVDASWNDVKNQQYENNHAKGFSSIKYAELAYDASRDRVDKIENKCLGLVQYTAVSAGLFGVIAFQPDKPTWSTITLIASIVFAIFSILLGSYGMKVSVVWERDFDKIDDNNQPTLAEDLRTTGLCSYHNNCSADFKADVLLAAQRYFIVSLLLVSFSICLLLRFGATNAPAASMRQTTIDAEGKLQYKDDTTTFDGTGKLKVVKPSE